jgi:hypothetical protein
MGAVALREGEIEGLLETEGGGTSAGTRRLEGFPREVSANGFPLGSAH